MAAAGTLSVSESEDSVESLGRVEAELSLELRPTDELTRGLRSSFGSGISAAPWVSGEGSERLWFGMVRLLLVVGFAVLSATHNHETIHWVVRRCAAGRNEICPSRIRVWKALHRPWGLGCLISQHRCPFHDHQPLGWRGPRTPRIWAHASLLISATPCDLLSGSQRCSLGTVRLAHIGVRLIHPSDADVVGVNWVGECEGEGGDVPVRAADLGGL